MPPYLQLIACLIVHCRAVSSSLHLGRVRRAEQHDTRGCRKGTSRPGVSWRKRAGPPQGGQALEPPGLQRIFWTGVASRQGTRPVRRTGGYFHKETAWSDSPWDGADPHSAEAQLHMPPHFQPDHRTAWCHPCGNHHPSCAPTH